MPITNAMGQAALKVAWLERGPGDGNTCDFCNGPSKAKVTPVVLMSATHKLLNDSGVAMTMPGPFGVCPRCQTALRIQDGDQEVSFAKVNNLIQEHTRMDYGQLWDRVQVMIAADDECLDQRARKQRAPWN